MKKSLFPLFLVLTFFLSCSDDENNINPNSNIPKLVEVQQYVVDSDGNPTSNHVSNHYYEHGANNFISKQTNSSGITFEFFYDSNDEITKVVFLNTNIWNTYEIEYVYESGLITKKIYDNGNYVDFVYQGNQVTQSFYYFPDTPNDNYSVSYVYDSNGNVTNIIDDSSSDVTISIVYDNKINPFRLMFPDAYNIAERISINNRIHDTDCNGTEYTLEYNIQELPKTSYHNDCQENIWKREYFYE